MTERSRRRRWSALEGRSRPRFDPPGVRIAFGDAEAEGARWEASIVVHREQVEPMVELEFTRSHYGLRIVRRCAVDDRMFDDLFSEDPERCTRAIYDALHRARWMRRGD